MLDHPRKRPARQQFPDHLPREQTVVPPPETCSCHSPDRLHQIGEGVTEMLGVTLRHWKVIQTVHKKFG